MVVNKEYYEAELRRYIESYIEVKNSAVPRQPPHFPESLFNYYKNAALGFIYRGSNSSRYEEKAIESRAIEAVSDAWASFFKKVDIGEIAFLFYEEQKKLAERWKKQRHDDGNPSVKVQSILLTQINDSANKVIEEVKSTNIFATDKFIAWLIIRMVYSEFYEFVKFNAFPEQMGKAGKATKFYPSSQHPANQIPSDSNSLSFDIKELLYKKVKGLDDEKQRMCLSLYLKGYKNQEIASETGYYINEVESAVQNGKRNLLKSFNASGMDSLKKIL